MKQNHRIGPSIAVLAAILSSMALSACDQPAQQTATNTTAAAPALPLTTGAETAPVYAPSVAALPAAPRPKIVRVASQSDQYAYVDQAASMGSALGSSPPDYGFDYGDVHPWVWRASDNAARLVEPIAGGYRYYYYQPGAAQPYLIRDPQYAYGFDNGQLVVVYDAHGAILPPQYIDRQADYAGRYLARANALYNASLRNQRHAVIAANWAARRAQIDAEQAQWAQQQSQYAAWQDYHNAHDAQQQAYWQVERQHRETAAAQFNQWHDAGYQGPPPQPGYGPAGAAVGAAAIGGVIGGVLAGRGHHDDHQQPNYAGQPAPQQPTYNGQPNAGRGFAQAPRPYNGQPDQAAAIAQARQQQAQADAARQAQMQQQAQAAAAERAQAIAQGRQQQAQADAARQADTQAQARAIAEARHQQAQQDAAHQTQMHADAKAQDQAQALAAHQAQDAARAQAMQAHQQQAAQAAAQHQAAEAAMAQAHQQQVAQAAAQHQAQAAAAAQAKPAAPAVAHAPHPDSEHPHNGRPEDGPRPQPPAQQ